MLSWQVPDQAALTSFYRAERAGVRIPQPDRGDTPMQLAFAEKLHLNIAAEICVDVM
jgi:hypothetical protein